MIILNGADLEPWRAKLSLPRSRLVDVSTAYSDQLMSVDSARSHQHGPRGQTEGGVKAWATWLDPTLAIAQVKLVSLSLTKLLPEESQDIKERSQGTIALLTQLEESIQAHANEASDIVVLSNSPQLCYLVRRLGWRMVLLPDDPAILQTESVFQEFINETKPSRALIVPSVAGESTKTLIQALGKANIVIDQIDLCVSQLADSRPIFDRLSANVLQIQSASGKLESH